MGSSVGFDVHDDRRSFDKEGISGEVRRFSKESVSYPNISLVSTPENKVELHKLRVLQSMFKATSSTSNIQDNSIAVYFVQDDKTIRLGKIVPRQVKAFIRLFDGNKLTAMLDSSTHLDGDYIYVLSD